MKRNKGSALISALFIISLVAIAAMAMTTRLQFDIYRTRLTVSSDKLYLASQAVMFWAMAELGNKKNHFAHSNKQGKLLEFPHKWRSIYPSLTIKGSLYDLQSRFNLNNLSDKRYQVSFLKFLQKLPIKLSATQREQLLIAIHSWLSPFQLGHGADELTSYYLQQKPPYLQSHQPMQTVSELRLIKGISAQRYRVLFPHFTALPEPTAININTAPKELLRTLGNGLSKVQVKQLLKARGKKGIRNVNRLNELIHKLNIDAEQITIESQYFLVIAQVADDNLSLKNYITLKRSKNKEGKISIKILGESLNSQG